MSWRTITQTLLLACLALANAGCLVVAAGAAGAGAATYFYVKGRLCQEHAASFKDSWYAVLKTLEEMQLPVESQANDGATGTITSHTRDGSAISVDLSTQVGPTAQDPTLTRICVRVGTFGDKEVSEQLLAKIAGHLAPGGLLPRSSPTAKETPTPSGIIPVGWNKPTETGPPPELPPETKKPSP